MPSGLAILLWGSLLLALVAPAMAGTEAAPELQDPAGDQAVAGDRAPEMVLSRHWVPKLQVSATLSKREG